MTNKFVLFVCGIRAIKTSLRVIAATKVIIVERQAYDVKVHNVYSFFFWKGDWGGH